MVAVMVAMAVGVLLGAFGVVAWALSAAKKDKRENDKKCSDDRPEMEVPENEP